MSSEDEETKRKKEEDKLRKDEERQRIDVFEVWREVQNIIQIERKEAAEKTSSGWKTVRIFVSSTFRDFHTEREELVKKVFPELRTWCEERRIHLVDCDLRWGVPEETPHEITLRICLEEIERCIKDNVMPYFLNMTSKRIGWIPLREELTEATIEEFKLIIGLSVTEMEIVHAAYRQDNPNSLFLIREDSFLEDITEDNVKKAFVDELRPIADRKLKTLKEQIEQRKPKLNIYTYNCSYKGEKLAFGRPKLCLEEGFSMKVLEFFKSRIEVQYPNRNMKVEECDKFVIATEQHKAFMTDRGHNVRGRDELANEILSYVASDDGDEPLLILGEPGAGKSAVMAMVANKIAEDPENKRFLFYHFVGATPGSTSLFGMLSRLLNDLKESDGYEMPTDLDRAVQEAVTALTKKNGKKIILFIDAVNQFDKETDAQLFSWLPEKLPSTVKCVLSMIVNSTSHKDLISRGIPEKCQKNLPVIKQSERSKIAKEYLIRFRKKLSEDQLLLLLDNESSKNPLWLKIACEELRLFGDFGKLTQQIQALPDSLPGLLKFVLVRFTAEMGDENHLLESTLCLLEVSKSGLLEVELLEMLANIDGQTGEDGEDKYESRPRLVAAKWASVYRNLRPFLRPFGNSSEGRLDFYHRSLSKVVRDLYLVAMETSVGDEPVVNANYMKWHKILANHFQYSTNYERIIEEYPYHLIRIKDRDRLEAFLLDWKAFDLLYDSEFSENLLKYWREAKSDDYRDMAKCYIAKLDEWKKDKELTNEEKREKFENISRLFTQAGLYEQALILAEECLKIIEGDKDSEQQQENLMYMYGHIANTKTQNMPETMDSKDISTFQEIIKYHEKAIDIIEKMESHDKRIKRFKALQLIKKGFCLGQIADRSTGFFRRKHQHKYREAGLEDVNKAKAIYREINDIGHLLEAFLVEGTLTTDQKALHKVHEDTMKQCRQTFGPIHHLMARVSFNEGIAYESEKKYEDAYKCFKRAYLIGKELFGSNHPKTVKYRDALMEKRYKQVAKKLNDDIDTPLAEQV